MSRNKLYAELIKLAGEIIYDATAISDSCKYLSDQYDTNLSQADRKYLDTIKSDDRNVDAHLIEWCWQIKNKSDRIKQEIWATRKLTKTKKED